MSEAPGGSGIVLLATDGASTRIVYHALRREFGGVRVILEDPVPRSRLLRRRMATQGPVRVFGQLLFSLGAVPLLRRSAARRIEEIKREHDLDDSPIQEPIVRVPSVNSEEARRVLRELAPRVVVVNGTRIIGRSTLGCVDAPFVNLHAGITPGYRGVHGGYWALSEGRPELVGTTMHFVDEGIDTGRVIDQRTFPVSPEDSFATYPYLHTAAGVSVLVPRVRELLAGTLRPREHPRMESRLWYHPTLWGYLAGRWTRNVK